MQYESSEHLWALLSGIAETSTCVRRQVGALVLDGREVVGAGWNVERDGLCDTDCPRAHSAAVRGVTSYDVGAGRCIAVHAEEMALLAAPPGAGELMMVSSEPCYKCEAMLERFGVEWVVCRDEQEVAEWMARHTSDLQRA